MTTLIITQVLNGLQFGLMLFLIATGLTLILGIMDFVNLAHGSLYMMGAYATATLVAKGMGFFPALLGGVLATFAVGVVIEVVVVRKLYRRDHLDHVLATFGIILAFNEVVRIIWGPVGLTFDPPEQFADSVDLLGFTYPAYRLLVIGMISLVGAGLWWLVTRTRIGMQIRAGATHPEIVSALGVNIRALKTTLFALGAALAAFSGALIGPLRSVQPGMGEEVLIQALVVIIVGGIGAIRGALVAGILLGLLDTLGRAFLPLMISRFANPEVAQAVGPALASMMIYLTMALVLVFKPAGLLPATGK
ncbi:MAG: branched-chain amino acid ABC transporter permease [Rhodocyclaceae bacterium]|nr:MAG: branched-chain amino acid ABC transporter permease [Rhodocyclaceae bacterium]